MKLKEVWLRIKSRIPVSRGRYERELSCLRLSVNRSIEEEKAQLDSLLNRLHYVTTYYNQGRREIRSSFTISDDLITMCRNPYERRRMFLEIGERTARELEREAFGAREYEV